jgi:hypothetical protein
LPVLDGGAGVVSGVAHDDVSVPGVVNADEQLVALLPVAVGVSGRLSVWILRSCAALNLARLDVAALLCWLNVAVVALSYFNSPPLA